MASYCFQTVDVFTAARFSGNQLAVFPDAEGLPPEDMQRLAAELNLSETTFVLQPQDPDADVRLRIFNRTAEMAFAGHPTIGSAFVLATVMSPDSDEMVIEVPAGLARVTLVRDASNRVTGARAVAPRTLEIGQTVSATILAGCLGLAEGAIVTSNHLPIEASMGNNYIIAEVTASGLAGCGPDVEAFRTARDELQSNADRFSVYAYHRGSDAITARMFAPLAGTWEDAATGSAAAPLAGLLLSLGTADRARFEICQGEAMGRPSLIRAEAWRDETGIRASIEGQCVPVFRGSFERTSQASY